MDKSREELEKEYAEGMNTNDMLQCSVMVITTA